MKKINTTIGVFLMTLFTVNAVVAQENRTLETKVADVLAQLPTDNLQHSDKLMKEIISLDAKGILQFTDMLLPLGTGNDTQARYAIESLAIYSGGLDGTVRNGVVENALLIALKKTPDAEIKMFLIERLMHCGTNASVRELSKYLANDKLFKPALATLTTIGTQEASKAVFEVTKKIDFYKQPSFITVLGKLNYKPSVGLLEQLAVTKTGLVQQKSLMALAEIASPSSKDILANAAKKEGFAIGKSKAILAFVHYGNRLNEIGNVEISTVVGTALLKNCKSEAQLHFRSAGIHLLRAIKGQEFTKTLIKEAKTQNNKYRAAVLDAASENLQSAEVYKWVKAYKKMPAEGKSQLLRMLGKRKEIGVFEQCVSVALNDKITKVRVAGIKALAFQSKNRAIPALLASLKMATSSEEYSAIKGSLLRVCEASDSKILASSIGEMNDGGKGVLVAVLAARKATAEFDLVASLVNNGSDDLKASVFSALPALAASANLSKLFELLGDAEREKNIANIQKAVIKVLDNSETDNSEEVIKAYNAIESKGKMLPILPALNNKEALTLVTKSLSKGSTQEKLGALSALANWRNNDALPYLFVKASIDANDNQRSFAFDNYLAQIRKSAYPADQKLLLLKKLMPFSKSLEEKKQILNNVGRIKTFLSLIFASEYLNTEGLVATASNAVIRIALPTPGKQDGLSGDMVRDIVSRSVANLTGQDSQYIQIDVKEFLDNMSKEKGFVSIFNSVDFTGWEGLVENPIARGKMSKRALAQAQEKANKQMIADWFIKDGIIGFKGEGYNNISTIKDYGDFEMLVDWKITNGGDSGIYLRGTPQVQIWDIANTRVGAQVGSGGLYNNQKNNSKPLQVADNPVNEWNTFRIKMVGARVTVHLNGVLVTDNVVLENFWDRDQVIFTKDAIELQAHGEDLGFRNIFVKEITSGDALVSNEELKDGFKSLFNGNDLNHWIGNKTDYLVEDNEVVVRPKQGGHGNLYTADEYGDFVFRFEFKLSPGANNGLGIHAPLEGDVAYVGKELQILDNTAAIYSKLKKYQYHGSVYGIMASKRGFLKPVGEWNSEEVIVQGDNIKITLNGTVILNGNIKEATKNGALDGQDHPGLKRTKGHIAFLGHGSELWFRNLRIKNLQ